MFGKRKDPSENKEPHEQRYETNSHDEIAKEIGSDIKLVNDGSYDSDIYYVAVPGCEDMDESIIRHVEDILSVVHPSVVLAVDMEEISSMSPEAISEHLKPIIADVLQEKHIRLNNKEQRYLETKLIYDMVGLGPIEPLLADDTVSDVLVNGCNRVFVERFGKLQNTTAKFRNDEHVKNVISRIVAPIGRRIDEQSPYVDARLPDGSRVNAIIPPLAIDGPTISIRKFKKQVLTLQDMVEQQNLSQQMADLLSIAIRSRVNTLVVGGTGAGKTTFLNALSKNINDKERIITIEDAAELQLLQPHVVRLETRPPNVEGEGEVNIRQLVINALRMRPDRIILGEIRGSEAFEMLQAMNTGHDGSMCTIHASSPREVPARLANMVMMLGYEFPPKAILAQIASSIQLLVQVSRMRDGKRRIINITEIVGIEDDVITMQDLFVYRQTGESENGELLGGFISTGIKPIFSKQVALYGLEHKLYESLQL